MVKKVCFVSVFAFMFLFLSDISMAQNMKEGLWEITMTMEMPGMPMKMPPQTFTNCLTKEDYVPQKEEKNGPNQDCKIIKQDFKGDTVTWFMECNSPEGKIVSKGKATYRGTTFDGIVKIKRTGMEITQKMNGKWIGKCK